MSMARVGLWLALTFVGLIGCSDEATQEAPTPPPCAAGELLLPSGECILPGLRPDDCASGFAHDGDRGCLPVLPGTCPTGLIAVPGDESCREVAACGEGRWGEIPLEPNSQHVDGAYAGTDSDGSFERPWQRIQAGVDAAAAGAVVAVAAGSYVEDVEVAGKAVRIWGRCPSQVELVGTGGAAANLLVLPGASNSEVHAIAITGGAFGIGTSNVTEVLFANLWIHDTGHMGLDAESADGDARIWVRDSLIERAVGRGVIAIGSELHLEGTVVRDTLAQPSDGGGYGALARLAPGGVPGKLVALRSVLERNLGFGVAVQDGELTLEASVVRDTLAGPDGVGVGIGVIVNTAPASLELIDSLVARNLQAGVFVEGAATTITGSVIRDTLVGPVGAYGLISQPNQRTGATAPLTISRSLIERGVGTGVIVKGGDLTVDRTVIRAIADSEGSFDAGLDRGLAVQAEPGLLVPASLLLTGSLVEGGRLGGVIVMSAVATIDASVIRLVQVAENGLGDGLLVVQMDVLDANATVTNTRIDDNERAAIALFGASLGIAQLRGTCNAIDIDGEGYSGQSHAIDDQGDNLCGCPEANQACAVVSLGLEPIFY